MSLTTHLLHSPLFHPATHHPFLSAAGRGTLSRSLLTAWLAQDRFYAQSYLRFTAQVLAHLTLPPTPNPADLQWRVSAVLVDALVNIRRELAFFEQTAAAYGLDLGTPAAEAEATAAYRALFDDAAAAGDGWRLALVVLWATEKCYLEAWRYAQSHIGEAGNSIEDADGGALRKEFIPNWTSEEFGQFVDTLAGLCDEVGDGLDAEGRQAAEKLWVRVCTIEKSFWPALE